MTSEATRNKPHKWKKDELDFIMHTVWSQQQYNYPLNSLKKRSWSVAHAEHGHSSLWAVQKTGYVCWPTVINMLCYWLVARSQTQWSPRQTLQLPPRAGPILAEGKERQNRSHEGGTKRNRLGVKPLPCLVNCFLIQRPKRNKEGENLPEGSPSLLLLFLLVLMTLCLLALVLNSIVTGAFKFPSARRGKKEEWRI